MTATPYGFTTVRDRVNVPTAASGIQIRHVSKRFGDYVALDGVRLDLARGRWVSLDLSRRRFGGGVAPLPA